MKHSYSAPEFFDELPLWSAPFGIALLEAVDYRSNTVALDLCSGTGFPALELATRLGRNSRVFALDNWPEACQRLRNKIEYFGLENIEVAEATAEELPFANDTFDLITSNNGINNVADPERALRECFRCSRLMAQLLITVNLPDTFSLFYDVLRSVLRNSGMMKEAAAIDAHIRDKRKPLEFTTALAERCGFKIIEAKRFEWRMYFSTSEAFFRHPLIATSFAPAWEECIPEDKRDDLFRNVSAKMDDYAIARGRLSMDVPYALIEARKNNSR